MHKYIVGIVKLSLLQNTKQAAFVIVVYFVVAVPHSIISDCCYCYDDASVDSPCGQFNCNIMSRVSCFLVLFCVPSFRSYTVNSTEPIVITQHVCDRLHRNIPIGILPISHYFYPIRIQFFFIIMIIIRIAEI